MTAFLLAAGPILQGLGGFAKGKQAASDARRNAEFERIRQQRARDFGAIERRQVSVQESRVQARAKTAFAGGGISVASGSAIDVAYDIAAEAVFERHLSERREQDNVFSSQLRETNFRNEARAQSAGAIGSLLGGALSAGGAVAGGMASAKRNTLLKNALANRNGVAGLGSGVPSLLARPGRGLF